ncbi:MAG: AAA family ATPase [Cyanobacteria bacterium J06626_23]
MPADVRRPLILLIGLPGSGKSTWARRFVRQFPRYEILSTDETRAQLYGDAAIQGEWMEVWQQLACQLAQGIQALDQDEIEGVLFDATNAQRSRRRRLIQTLTEIGYSDIGAVWFDLSLAECQARSARRHRQVPAEVIERMHRELAGGPPNVAEGLSWLIRL